MELHLHCHSSDLIGPPEYRKEERRLGYRTDSTCRLDVLPRLTILSRVGTVVSSVPFLDLRRSHDPLKDAFLERVSALVDTNAFINGPDVANFERSFADWVGTSECVGLASGLDAIRLALMALDIGPGDEVIVPAMTFVATCEAVTQAGGRPVLVDVRPDDYCIDPAAVEAAIGPRTKALLPVHLYGQMADMRRLSAIAEKTGIALVEDAAQAHGAERDGLRAGRVGRVGCFSFYPGKNLGAFGDAGAVTLDDPALAARMRAYREHGQVAKYQHAFEGYTARLDTIQAIALDLKLPYLDGWTAERRAAAATYLEELVDVGDLGLPSVPVGSDPVWHLFVVTTADPDGFQLALRASGVASGRHYPDPIHLTQAYVHLGYPAGAFPVAERLGRGVVSLPMFPGITEVELEQVLGAVRAAFDG
jgi:dTDP-4-amino-4,6-dideoxygalactose transaminase